MKDKSITIVSYECSASNESLPDLYFSLIIHHFNSQHIYLSQEVSDFFS